MVHRSLLHRLTRVLESNEVEIMNERVLIVSVYLLSPSLLPEVSRSTHKLNNTLINSLFSVQSKYQKVAKLLVFRSL